MYCPTCGSENPDGSKVCEKCGANLTEDVQNIGNSKMTDEYEVEYSGAFRRIFAYIIDYIILFIVEVIVGTLVGYNPISSAIQLASGKAINVQAFKISAALSLIITIAYFVLLESSPKQGSLGKMLLGMKITDENGARISALTALKRYILFDVFSIISLIVQVVQGPPKVGTGIGTATIIGYIGFAYYIVILIFMLSSQFKQGLHDKLAKTYVVSK